MFLITACGNAVTHYKPYSFNGDVYTFTINVDKNTTNKERKQIILSSIAWQKASGEKVKFVFNWNYGMLKGVRSEINSPSKAGIFFWVLSNKEKKSFDNERLEGLFFPVEQTSFIFEFPQTFTSDHFYPVAVHEFGHLLGLKHSDSVKSIMNKHVTGDCITIEDAKHLCGIYHCKPTPGC